MVLLRVREEGGAKTGCMGWDAAGRATGNCTAAKGASGACARPGVGRDPSTVCVCSPSGRRRGLRAALAKWTSLLHLPSVLLCCSPVVFLVSELPRQQNPFGWRSVINGVGRSRTLLSFSPWPFWCGQQEAGVCARGLPGVLEEGWG